MTAPVNPDYLGWAKDVGVPIFTFIMGGIIARWTLTKKDRKELEQKNYENATTRITQHDAAYQEYAAAITAYNQAQAATADSFFAIATKGERYFYELSLMSAAILSDKVDRQVRDDILLRKLRSASAKTLPQHYEVLQSIARKYGFPYSGVLRRADYEPIYAVIEKFGPGPEWTQD